MANTIRKVNVIGHLHPDSDSICSAIAYAYLKNQISEEPIYQARRAGAINRETAFVLDHFGFEEPELITSVTPQIKDAKVMVRPGIDCEQSLFATWNTMIDTQVDTLCVTDDEDNLLGLITIKDIANANMDIFDISALGDSETKFKNIVETLDGELVLGDPEGRVAKGNIRVGSNPEMMEGLVEEGDLVLVTNRYESQRFAVESGAKCMVICNGAHVSGAVRKVAEESNCTVITTPHDTYAAARLISMAMPVRAKMVPGEKIIRFSVNTSVDDANRIMASSRHRFCPVVDEAGHYTGLINAANLLSADKKHVILVDHNERAQAVDGLEQAEIMEIIDHHRIGSIETSNPVMFRNMPVGCTCTIIYGIFQENDLEIPPNIAGLMMSAILSDTLVFRSPTCTDRDRYVGEQLAKICGEDINAYAEKMFDAGADLTGRTAEDVFHQDFKVFSRGNVRFGVGQGSFVTENSRMQARELVGPYLDEGARLEELPMVFYMFTDVKSQSTDMMCSGKGAETVIERAFGVKPEDGVAVLPGIVSRKKQVIPSLMNTIQALLEEEANA